MSAAAIEVSETCRCGGSLTVKGLNALDARNRLLDWREAHRCLGPDEQPKAPERSGASTVLGFQPRPWDHDRGPVLR